MTVTWVMTIGIGAGWLCAVLGGERSKAHAIESQNAAGMRMLREYYEISRSIWVVEGRYTVTVTEVSVRVTER